MEQVASLLPLVAIAAIFWLLIIRPASRQRKKTAELQAALAVGDDVMLTSGIFGTIRGETDEHLELELAPGVVIRVVRGAVASVRHESPQSLDGPDGAESTEAAPADVRPDDEEER